MKCGNASNLLLLTIAFVFVLTGCIPPATEDTITLTNTLMITEPLTMELAFVPAGQFLMGSDPSLDTYASRDDQPQHVVELPGFYIGKYEVTNQQYEIFTEVTEHRIPRHWSNNTVPPGKENHPVVWVSWDDAVEFAKWLSEQTEMDFRLPSEVEWEKACRGTNGGIYPWGNSTPDDEKVNYNGNVDTTTKVGLYSPLGDSPYGAADMAGNVWEWTSSLFADLPYAVDSQKDMEATGRRVMRGGAFYWGNEDSVRCAERDKVWMVATSFMDNDVGFRVVMHP